MKLVPLRLGGERPDPCAASDGGTTDIRIDRIAIGVTSCYLVRQEGTLLVDCGMAGAGPGFRKALEGLGVRPEQVGLILLTHGHDDHAGPAREIADITGAKIAMHRADGDWLA